MIDPGLQNRIVLVTGANSPMSIGAAVAHAFARQGAAVFLTYCRSADEQTSEEPATEQPGRAYYRRLQNAPIEPVLESIRALVGRAEAWVADLANVETIAELFDRAETAFGAVDILVNDAAHRMADTFLPRSVL